MRFLLADTHLALVRAARALGLGAVLAALGACGGSGFNGHVYHGERFAFAVGPVPARWRKLDVSHAALAFRDDRDEATIAANGRCRGEADDVPLKSLTQHLFMRFTERQIERQEVVPFDQREAMHSVVVAKLDGVPMKFDVWVMKKDGCVYDLMYMAPPDRFGRGSLEFSRFVSGFHTVSSDAN